jgi:hypothetical protein
MTHKAEAATQGVQPEGRRSGNGAEFQFSSRKTAASALPHAPACGQASTVDDDWKFWASQIKTAWQKCVQGIVETGQLLIEARAELEHGRFESMVQLQLPFGPRTAQMLMFIASNPAISKAKHVSHLPAAWGTLHALAHLPPTFIEEKIESGEIHSKMERKDAAALLGKPPRKKPELEPEPDATPREPASDMPEVLTPSASATAVASMTSALKVLRAIRDAYDSDIAREFKPQDFAALGCSGRDLANLATWITEFGKEVDKAKRREKN